MFRLIILAFVFASGVGGNLISQALRGIGNLIKGFFCFVSGFLLALISCVQWIGGGKKEATETLFVAKKNLAIAFWGLFCGFSQLAFGLTFASPILRGSQIVSESFAINGIYAPAGKNRTRFQNLFGLNSWQNQQVVSRSNNPVFVRPRQAQNEPRQVQDVFVDTSKPVFIKASKPKRKENALDTNLKKLVMSYKASRTSFRSGSRTGPKDILASIALQYPKYYQTQIDRSCRKKLSRQQNSLVFF